MFTQQIRLLLESSVTSTLTDQMQGIRRKLPPLRNDQAFSQPQTSSNPMYLRQPCHERHAVHRIMNVHTKPDSLPRVRYDHLHRDWFLLPSSSSLNHILPVRARSLVGTWSPLGGPGRNDVGACSSHKRFIEACSRKTRPSNVSPSLRRTSCPKPGGHQPPPAYIRLARWGM